MTNLELNAIENYAQARLDHADAKADLYGYRPEDAADYQIEAVRDAERAEKAAYKALPLAYAILLAERQAAENAAWEAWIAEIDAKKAATRGLALTFSLA